MRPFSRLCNLPTDKSRDARVAERKQSDLLEIAVILQESDRSKKKTLPNWLRRFVAVNLPHALP